MSTAAPVNSDSNPVHRTIQDINGDQPIRIAVRLHDPTPVMVHITAITASGTTLLYATRCYVPSGVLRDEVLLVPTDATEDADGDGWSAPTHVDATCRDPGPGSTGVACDIGLCAATEAGDCNDTAAAAPPVNCALPANQTMGPCIYPGAPAVCGDGIDQDCRSNGLPGGSRDEACGDMDGDGVNACGPAGGVCDCNDNDPAIYPAATDVCGNGIDEDCSGEPGGMGAFCDADGDTYPSNVDCDDMNPAVHPGGLSLERCVTSGSTCTCDGIDNNCNGLTDEDASCQSPDLDGDGSDACAAGVTDCGSCDCNDCDSGIHPGATDVCGDTIDEDGVGGDMPCPAGDADHDGFAAGGDCNDADVHVHVDAPENCTTTASESCGTMSCPASVDVDMDGFAAASVGGTDCSDSDAMVNAWATEMCNGLDDDCDGDADEVLDPANQTGCVTDPSCPGGSRCPVHFDTNIHHCGGCRRECNPGTTLVADQCVADACSCTTNPGGAACAVGSTCCGTTDGMGNPVTFPGCFDTDTATQNCGGCGNVCDPTTADSCAGGRCVCGGTGAACGVGQTCCGGQCVNLATDTLHCGRCDRVCGPRTACNAGTCGCDDPTTHGDCSPADIGQPGGNGCETDLLTDANFCGTCAQSCLDEHVATGTCSGGACTIGTCQTLYGDCNGGAGNGCETSLSTTGNCGACGNVCNPMNANAVCNVAGSTASCGYGTCTGTFESCDSNVMNGCETSLRATGTCGACTTDCNVNVRNATPTCSAGGACDYSGSCAAGTSDCDSTRANGCEPFATTHCGAACTNCSSTVLNASGPMCTGGGTCGFASCNAGATNCDGNAANGCETWNTMRCGAGCTNCTTAVSHGTGIACSGGGACTFSGCASGYIDCDGMITLGCEQAQDATHCGAACTNCMSLPNVAATTCSGGGTCTVTSCRAGFLDCTAAAGCEQTEDTSHCGSGCTNCTTIPNVTGLGCTSGSCTYSGCAGGFVDCTAAAGCETAQDATHCGATCVNCNTMLPNATTSCGGGTCTLVSCNAGFRDCTAAPGCETPQDIMHCGASCTNCTTTVLNVATVTCGGSGTCGFSGGCTGNACNADGMATNGCEGTQSPTACGPTCATDCTTGFMHGSAGCSGGACTVASCSGMFANCDGTISNGCETMTAGDDADCCGAMCAGATTCMGSATTGYSCM